MRQRWQWRRGNARWSVWMGYSVAAMLLLSMLAACGATTKPTAHHTPTVAPTATPEPHGWNLFMSPRVGEEGNLTAVAAISASDAWAVGQYEGLDSVQRTLTEHWNGSQWLAVDSPAPGARYNTLLGVSAASTNDVWAVGYTLSTSGVQQPLIEHWNGSAWRATPTPIIAQPDGELGGVAAISANDAWAVGSITNYASAGNGVPPSAQPLIEHWNGSAWSIVSGPTPGGSGEAGLSAITALSANNVWAVGSNSGNQSLIEHWDGSQWHIAQSANPQLNGNMLSGIAAVSANDIWAVGSGPSSPVLGCGVGSSALIEHWNGTSWSGVPVAQPKASEQDFSLASIAATSANDVWAVGGALGYYRGGSTSFTPLIEHWNGARWSIVSGPTNGTAQGLMGVAAAGGAVWAVGQGEAANGPGATQVEQWNGSKWAVVDSPSPGTLRNALNGVTAISSSDVWAVGSSAGGTLTEHWDGANWSVQASPNAAPADDTLNSVAATSSSDVWAVGAAPGSGSGYARDDLIEHWNGAQWSIVPGADSKSQYGGVLYNVAAISPTNAWAVGIGGGPLIEHWDGAHWNTVPSPTTANGLPLDENALRGIAVVSPNDIWAVGGNDAKSCAGVMPPLIEHWNGKQWSIVPPVSMGGTLVDGNLSAVSADGPNDVWAVGTGLGSGVNGALIMHWDGKKWSVVPAAPAAKNNQFYLSSVVALASGDVWAVGRQYDPQASARALVEHWNGSAWSVVSAPSPSPDATNSDSDLACITAVSASSLWAVGDYNVWYDTDQALIEHYNA